MKIYFAAAEAAPHVKVGGLGDAAAGLVAALSRLGAEVRLILPDYGGLDFREESAAPVTLPPWAGPVTARRGSLDGFDRVTLLDAPSMRRPHPYVDASGEGWPDNDYRFLTFSAAVAALADEGRPDVLHLNDWHTGAALGLTASPPPSVLTVHNLAYQGTASAWWLQHLPNRSEAYEWHGEINPLSGAIALADRVVAVSAGFAAETLRSETGFGLHEALAAKGDSYMGIINGIETDVWDPAADPHLDAGYGAETASRKRGLGRRLAAEVGLAAGSGPIVAMVTRLTDQKGVDIALEAAETLPDLGARMVLLGSGEHALAAAARALQSTMPGRFAFRFGYDEALSHRIFAGSDLFLMPSRFEPCGLAQMQAMRYGAIPVVTAVGGLADTVIDADTDPDEGVGFVAPEPTAESVADALRRAVRAWRSTRRRGAIRRRAMATDWSWDGPARRYLSLYRDLTSIS